MKIELKNVVINSRLSEETTCFSASMYINGEYAADVRNNGTGGCNTYYYSQNLLPHKREEFLDYCRKQPPIIYDGVDLEMDEDMYIGQLIEEHQKQKFLKKQCIKRTLFVVKGDVVEKDGYRTIGKKYCPEIKKYLVQQFGPKLDYILNERI
jgi:hypothetical protein